MRGIRITTASILLLFAGAATAAQPDYFPLHAGNQWIYRETGAAAGPPIVVGVAKVDVIDGRAYSLVQGFPGGEAWLRMSEEGILFAYDPAQKRDKVWAAFLTPEGQSYATEITDCNQRATVESRNAKLQVPIGEFNTALHIVYPPGGCADAGITGEFYLPYIGLIERSVTTIAGPRTLQLIYARVGGVTVVSAPEISFSLTLDRLVYTAEDTKMTARLTLRNTQAKPVELTFPSGQRYDLVLKNEKGDTVFRWSDGKFFTQVVGTESIGPGERNYVIETPLADAKLPAGSFIAEGWLTTMGPRIYAASVGFQIQRAP